MSESPSQPSTWGYWIPRVLLFSFIFAMSGLTVCSWHTLTWWPAIFAALGLALAVFLVCGLLGIPLISSIGMWWLWTLTLEGGFRGFQSYHWLGGIVGLVLGHAVGRLTVVVTLVLLFITMPTSPPVESVWENAETSGEIDTPSDLRALND